MTQPIDTALTRELVKASTPGPWTVCRRAGEMAELVSIADDTEIGLLADHDAPDSYTPDQALIVHLRNNALAMCDEIDRLRAREGQDG